MKTTLSGDWKLYYHPEDGAMPQTPAAMKLAAWPSIDAKVPGNVELDLVRAGIEDDPFYAENIYNFRKYEFYQWWFERTFIAPEEMYGRKCVLRFGGIDTYADVFLNEKLIGSCDDMFIEQEFDVTNALNYGGENTLTVRIRSALNAVRDKDYPVMLSGNDGRTEYALIRKAPSMFGWDIMPRLLSAGLWRDVTLEALPDERFTQVYIATHHIDADGKAHLALAFRFHTDDVYMEDFRIRVHGECGDSVYDKEMPALFTACSMNIDVPNAKLWWPRHYGEQALYNVTVQLVHNGHVADEYKTRVGIRTLNVVTKWAANDEGEFRIECNGVKILAKGSNWVPMDAMHSRDASRVKAALDLFYDAGCNIVRCWGGNVYEDHPFFDLCDEYGIMVWQDFAMACSTYPPTPEFEAAIEKEATAVVRKLRNHACILLWAGDNEVDETLHSRFPIEANRYNAITRDVLPRVVRVNDPFRLYLPSSPYIPEGIARDDVPEQHNWGARAYFKDDFYKHSTAHFISECGYHGCPAPSSLKKFIPEDKLYPRTTNSVWITHDTDYLPAGERGYNRIMLMTDQVEIFFGEVPEDLTLYSHLSQIVQAEAKKFFIERARMKKWRRTGIIWWNMIDGWPQISDAVVDYYYTKKLAYNYIKRVQKPICLMMDELDGWNHSVVLGNDSCLTKNVSWRVEDGDTGEILLSGETLSPANENVTVGSLRVLSGEQKLFILRWTIDGVEHANHFLSGFPHFDKDKVLHYVDVIQALPEPFGWED